MRPACAVRRCRSAGRSSSKAFVEAAGGDELPFDDRRHGLPSMPAPRSGAPPRRRARPLGLWERDLLPRDGSSTPAPRPGVESIPNALRAGALAGAGAARRGTLPELSPFRVVVLCNVADLAPASASLLSRFVASGGNLIIFTGDRVKAGAYAALERAGLLPAQVDEPADAGSYRFTDWVKGHPIFGPFADPQYGDLWTLRVVDRSPGSCPTPRPACSRQRRAALPWWSRKQPAQEHALLLYISGR